jgi:hypothetical protein
MKDFWNNYKDAIIRFIKTALWEIFVYILVLIGLVITALASVAGAFYLYFIVL